MYELTKILGALDLTGLNVTDELRHDFLLRGHITLDDKGDRYLPSDIVGGPIALITRDNELQLYAKIFDGPDKNLIKAQRLVQTLHQGVHRFRFKAILGKTADGEKLKLRVALQVSADQRGTVKLSPQLNLDEVAASGVKVETA